MENIFSEKNFIAIRNKKGYEELNIELVTELDKSIHYLYAAKVDGSIASVEFPLTRKMIAAANGGIGANKSTLPLWIETIGEWKSFCGVLDYPNIDFLDKTLNARGKTFHDVNQQAKKAKDDEYYTRYEDVCRELDQYPISYFEGKKILCNCNDAVCNFNRPDLEWKSSAFVRYFINNAEKLGIAELVCIGYGGGVDLYGVGEEGYIYRHKAGDDVNTIEDRIEHIEGFSGSFDDELSIKLLKEADVVVTNPPFSRSMDLFNLLWIYDKEYIVIGNTILSVTRPEIYRRFANRSMSLGFVRINEFIRPNGDIKTAAGNWYTSFNLDKSCLHKKFKILDICDIPKKYIVTEGNVYPVFYNLYIPLHYSGRFCVSVGAVQNGLLDLGYHIVDGVKAYNDTGRPFAYLLIQKDGFNDAKPVPVTLIE
jgi:hypothetical protein